MHYGHLGNSGWRGEVVVPGLPGLPRCDWRSYPSIEDPVARGRLRTGCHQHVHCAPGGRQVTRISNPFATRILASRRLPAQGTIVTLRVEPGILGCMPARLDAAGGIRGSRNHGCWDRVWHPDADPAQVFRQARASRASIRASSNGRGMPPLRGRVAAGPRGSLRSQDPDEAGHPEEAWFPRTVQIHFPVLPFRFSAMIQSKDMRRARTCRHHLGTARPSP